MAIKFDFFLNFNFSPFFFNYFFCQNVYTDFLYYFKIVVFKPIIDTITDPDFFNRNIISYIETTQMQINLPKKFLENASNFEDLIDRVDDIPTLRSIR